MGCFWSNCGYEHEDACLECGRRPVNNLVVINHVCEICTSRSRSRATAKSNQLKPLYGEYKCSCGRFWSSRYARAGLYQNCERCRKSVYPQKMREVQSSDYDSKEDKEHKKELCQMCQQLGYHCGQYGKNDNRSRSQSQPRQNRFRSQSQPRQNRSRSKSQPRKRY